MFLIDIRLSRPEALSFSKRLQWSQLRVPPRGLGIRVCLLMGVLGTHSCEQAQPCASFVCNKGKKDGGQKMQIRAWTAASLTFVVLSYR
jgi:hypothetical protein